MSAAALIVGLMMAASAANAAVRVTFVSPERYQDEDLRSGATRDGILLEFRKFFDKLGSQYLKFGETLSVDVLNIDLAGEYEPWRGSLNNVRILRDITPPSFRLRYTLTRGKTVVARNEETITDMNYLSDISAHSSTDRFAYEKDMLRDWFRRRFAIRAE
ncbi:MAG: DUF3016 domain-containing protein [Pseudomonadota bacterium]